MQVAGMEIHEIALAVLKKSADERLEEEIGLLMKWLREMSNRDAKQGKVTVLGEIQDEVLHEIVRGCKLATYSPNQVLIKQGNVGYTMYIILTGMCDIRIASADTVEEEEKEGESAFDEGQVLNGKPEAIEAMLGVSVGTFKAGHAFGEVALVSGVLRTASVIVNPDSEPCQVLVIDKQLFDRTLQDYMLREEANKLGFVDQFDHFTSWAPKFRQQLLRGLSRTRFKYDETVVRQGDEIDCVYFIARGEVKLSMIPGMHRQQYHRFLGQHTADKVFGVERRQLNERLRGFGPSRQWCCLADNELLGGVELLLGMRTYMAGGVATVETSMYRLNIREWSRLVERRHPQTLASLKADLTLRLSQRTLLPQTSHCPLIGYSLGLLYKQLRQQDKQQQQQQQQSRRQSGRVRPPAGLQLPKVGPLIDLWGRGTVFDYINRRFRRQQLRVAREAAKSGEAHNAKGVESRQTRQQQQQQQEREDEEEEEDGDELMYRDRCKLLRILVEGQRDTRPQLGKPFLVREELEMVGMERLESSIFEFCERLRKPGDRCVTMPQLCRPQLLEPPKEPSVGVLRPVQRRRRQRKQLPQQQQQQQQQLMLPASATTDWQFRRV